MPSNPEGTVKSNFDIDAILTSPRNFIGSGFRSDPRTGRGNGQLELLLQIALLAGFNIIYHVHDTEASADWSESDSGTFDRSDDSGDTRVGTNAMLLTATLACDNTQFVNTVLINGSAVVQPDRDGNLISNWEDTQYVGFWIRAASAGDFGTAGELQFAITYKDPNTGLLAVSSKINVPAATVSVHQRVELDLTTLTDSAGDAIGRDRVLGVRFYCNNANAGEAVLIEEVTRYLFGNGRGPVQGPCEMHPIASAATVTRGDIMSLEVGGSGTQCRAETAADQSNTRGVAVISGLGVANLSVFATVQTGGPVYLRANEAVTAELGVEWATGNEVDANDSADIGVVFGKAFEAAGAALDDFLVVLGSQANEG